MRIEDEIVERMVRPPYVPVAGKEAVQEATASWKEEKTLLATRSALLRKASTGLTCK